MVHITRTKGTDTTAGRRLGSPRTLQTEPLPSSKMLCHATHGPRLPCHLRLCDVELLVCPKSDQPLDLREQAKVCTTGSASRALNRVARYARKPFCIWTLYTYYMNAINNCGSDQKVAVPTSAKVPSSGALLGVLCYRALHVIARQVSSVWTRRGLCVCTGSHGLQRCTASQDCRPSRHTQCTRGTRGSAAGCPVHNWTLNLIELNDHRSVLDA